MKKRVLFLITLMFVLFSVNSLFADRDLNGTEVVCDSTEFTPNSTSIDWTFTIYNASPDSETVTEVILFFPDSVYVNSSTDFINVNGSTSPSPYDLQSQDQTGHSVNVSWSSAGLFSDPIPADSTYEATVNVDISGLTGPLVIPWLLNGGGQGDPEHSTDGYIVLGPPYAILDFSITNPSAASGTSGEWIVGDTLCVQVITQGEADTVRVDLSEIGGAEMFYLTQDPADSTLWEDCYIITDDHDDDTNATITATAWFPAPASLYDYAEIILDIDNELPEVTGWGHFEVIDYDSTDTNNIADWNYIAADSIAYYIGQEDTGDGIVWKIPEDAALIDSIVVPEPGPWDAKYVRDGYVLGGGINWDYWDPTIYVYDDAGNYVPGNAVNPDSLAFVDNRKPNDPDTTYFEVGHGATREIIDPYAGIGDTITAFVDFTTMAPIASGEFDFSNLFDAGDSLATGFHSSEYIIPGVIDGNLIYGSYVVREGDVDQLPSNGFPYGLIVGATLIDSAGNFSDPAIEIGGTTGDTLYVDGTAPWAYSDIYNTGYLRFSPDTDSSLADYLDYTNHPDTILLAIDFESWGEPGGPDEFTIRIEQENLARDEENPRAFKTYTVADSGTSVWWEESYEELVRASVTVYFIWDGVIPADTDFGVPGEIAEEGTYGFTLWSFKDGADNEGVVDHVPDINNVEYMNGIFLLNAEHGVIDNTPPEYDDELAVLDINEDTVVDTIYRWINDLNYNGIIDAGDALLTVDSVYFQFDVTRQWEENDNPLRDETVTYWIELVGPDTTRFFWGDEDSNTYPPVTGIYGVDPSTFVEYDTEDSVLFGTYNEINSTVGAGKDIMWVPDDEGGLDDLLFPAGTYEVTSKIRDNAGNIRDGLPTRATVEVVDMLYNAPVPDSLVIISEHTCPDSGLDVFDIDGNHNFYVDASYDTLRKDYYYNSPDIFEVYLRLADISYLDSIVVENLYPIVTHGPARADTIDGQLPDLVFYPGDFDPVTFDLTFSHIVAGIDETAAWDSLYTVGYLNTAYPGLAFQVRVYDSYYGGEINFGSALADSFNLIRPEQPVWPGEGDYMLDVVVSDDRFSPGWYTHTYDAVDNPARDGEQDQVTVDLTYHFDEPTTRDFTWFLAIDTEPVTSLTRMAFADARFSRSELLAAGDTSYTIPTIDFYGLQNNITLEPIIPQLETGKLFVTAFALAEGYEDCGYVLPPAIEATSVIDTLWVDNTNPGIIPEDAPDLYDWYGDPNYAGHLYEIDQVVSYDKNEMTVRFRTDETLPDSTVWTAVIVDENGDPLIVDSNTIGVNVVDVVGFSANFTSNDMVIINEFEGYTEFEMDVTIDNIPVGGQYLDCVLVVMAPADDAGNPDYLADPHYPFDTEIPYHAGSDAYRWDTSEAFVRFMILEEIPYIGEVTYTHENTYGEIDTANVLTGQGYIKANGTFDFTVTIRDLLWTPTQVMRNINSIVDVDFSAFGDSAVAEEPNGVPTLIDSTDNAWQIVWTDVPAEDIDTLTRYPEGTILNIPVDFELEFTAGPDTDDTQHEFYLETDPDMPVIVDIVNPSIDIVDVPEEVIFVRDPDMLEGTQYRVRVIRTDDGSSIYGVGTLPGIIDTVLVDTLVCDDPAVVIEKEYTAGDTVAWLVTVPEEDPVRVKTFTATAWDNVNNMNTAEQVWDIGNVPVLAIDDFFNATYPTMPARYFLTDGNDADLYVTIVDTERVELVNVWLNTDFVYPAVSREQYLADSVLTFTMEEFLALPDLQERAVILGEVNKVISLGSVNALGTLDECEDVDAYVEITHEYDHSDDASYDDTEAMSGLTIDNSAPTIENITYTLNEVDPNVEAAVIFEADIFDNPVSCPVGLNEILLYIDGINGVDSGYAPTDVDGDTYTWEFEWDADFTDNVWDVLNTLQGSPITGYINITANDYLMHENSNSLEVDELPPTVDDVTFWVNGVESNVIFPDESPDNVGEVWIDVTVTSTEEHVLYGIPDRVYVEYDGNLGGTFDSGDPVLLTGSRVTDSYTFRFYDVTFDSLEVPYEGFDIADFTVYAITMYNGRSADYQKQMIVVDYPREDLYGILDERAQGEYAGVDPSGWFAPEHNIQGTMTFVSPNELDTETVSGNFDQVGDFVEPWIQPDDVLMIDTDDVVLMEGTPWEVTVTLYTQDAIWEEVITDAQSIWNQILPEYIDVSTDLGIQPGMVPYDSPTPGGNVDIQDGYQLPIPVVAWQLGYELPWIPKIKVDMNDPAYSNIDGSAFAFDSLAYERIIEPDNSFWLELSNIVDEERVPMLELITTGDTTWDPATMTYTVEIPFDEIPFTEDIVLTTYASDWTPEDEYPSVGGAGVLRIDAPTPITIEAFAVNPYADDEFGFIANNVSPQPGDSIYYANWILSPLGDGFVHGDEVVVQLGQVWDEVGHNEGYAPEFTIVFSAQYQDVDTDELLIYDYKGFEPGGDPENPETAPYVKAGDRFGIQIPVIPFDRSTAIANVKVFTGMLENYVTSTEEADSLYDDPFYWITLTQSADFINNNLYYLDQQIGRAIAIDSNYVDGDQLYTKILITYQNGSVQPTEWITARTENYAIVDGVDPFVQEYGIEIWSETLEGPDVGGEEGYVMPGDVDGHLRITFEDNIMEYDLGAVPMLEVWGLDLFVTSRQVDGIDVPMVSPYYMPADSYDAQRGVWISEIDSLLINCDAPVAEQHVIEVNLWDPVGNAYDGNPASKFVEVTEDGPIVPVIRGIAIEAGDFPNPIFSADPNCPYTEDMMVETWPGVDFNSAAVGPDATITFKVYVRAEYEAYIEGLWLDLSELGGPAEAYIPHSDIVAVSTPDDNLWVGTYVLEAPELIARTPVIDITAYTIRHPFGAFDVFNDNYTTELNIDQDDVGIEDTHVSTNYPTVDWVINPDASVEIWATFTDLLGEFPDSLAWLEIADRSLPVDIWNWFSVQNNGVDNFFSSMTAYNPDDVQCVDEDAVECYWYFDSSDLHSDMHTLYEGTEDQFVNILFNTQNIYGETFSWDSDPILVDDLAPRFDGDTYTYGENHEPNRTIVPYYNDGSDWDENAMMHLVYEDVSGIDEMWTDWSEFGGTQFYTDPDVVRSTEEFTFPFGPDIYDASNIPGNPYDDDAVSWNDFVDLTLTDNVFNVSDTNYVNTTFVFREDDDYESFDVTMYPNENFVNEGGYWYTVNPYMEFYVEHNVMGYDNIDNDVELPFDAMHEGILFDPLYLEVNHHVYNNWYPFPHEFHMVNDTMVISMEGQYELLTDGVYDLEVHTENIFNHQIMGNLRFSVDNRAPIVTAFAFDGGNDFDMNDVVIVYSDWDEISIRFRDPIITGSGGLPDGPIPGVGVNMDTTFVNTWAQLYAGEDTSGDQVSEIVPLEWSGGRLILGIDDSRWAGDNLEPGYYTLLFHVTDLLGNSEEYTKTFFYNHQEPEVELHVFDHNYEEINASDILDISDEIAHMGATVNDEFGMVTGVSFELWFDEDGDEELSADDVQYSELPDDPMDHLTSIEGMPDPSVPFEATWHILDWEYLYDIVSGARDAAAVTEHVDAYNYRHDESIFNTDTRYWFIVTTVESNSGQSIQDTTKWMVRDDVGPAPMLTGITNSMLDDGTYYLEYDFDYNDYFHNTSTLSAICQYDSDGDGEIDTNWPDAWKVDFIIEGPNDYYTEITDTYMQPPLPNQPGYYTGFWDWSQLALDNPGAYTITARGWDRVSNSEMSLNSFDVFIYTESTTTADLSMWNFDLPQWDDAVLIPDGSEYGPIDPIENIINLRIDVDIYDVDEILEVGLFYNIYDNVTGEYVAEGLTLPNDTDINPDFPALLDHIYPHEMEIDGTDASFRVVVPEDVYMGPDYEVNDYTYEFEIWLTDFAGMVYDPDNLHLSGGRDSDPTEHIRVDYVAPAAYMMDVAEVLQGDNVDDATVVVPQDGNAIDEWNDGYDLGGDHSLVYKWSYDGVEWTYFVGEGTIYENAPTPTREYWYNNWDTRVLDALDVFNYEGWVYITAEVEDMRGNWTDAEPTMVYVDNQAPSVPITEVAYRSLPGVDYEDPSLYLDWHDLGFLLGEEDNTITCVYNPQSTEDALLRMRVHQSEIENLSYYNIEPGADSDIAMPVTLLWQQGDEERPYDVPVELAYDHEIDPDGWFHFEVLLDGNFADDVTHYFAFVADDVFGNVEGDQPVFDYMVDSDEFADMWDLRVNVVNDEPVYTSIVQPPLPSMFMSEIVNIGAVIDENEADKPINFLTFQVSPDAHTWTDIATEEFEFDRGDGVEDFTFHIYRHELPWFNTLPYVPGIHIYHEGEEIGDMNNIHVDDPFGDFDPDDGPMGAWTKTLELPVGSYGSFEFFIDVDNDGFAVPGDPSIPGPGHEYHGIEIVENMIPYDTRELRIEDGLYYFRAVPHTPEMDPRGANLAEYQVDNTPPTLLLDIVANDDEVPTFSYYHDSVDFVTDVNDLLVYPADFLVVEYQYSVEAPGTEFRQWFLFDATNMLPGDFGTTLDLDVQTLHPMYDDIDNDGDGLVDEADEANAYMYVRTWSHDPAGNVSYSNEEMILVDGSEPYLHITSIGGQMQSGPDWVVDIPADGMIELIATDITPEYLDDAVMADFYYKATHDVEYTLIEDSVEVIDGVATWMWDINEYEEREPGIILEEGYYTLMVIGWDRVMNETDQSDPLFVETTFILNDATGPEAYISSIGTSTQVEDTNFFGNAEDYNDEVTVMITNPEDVATVTLEYSIDGETYHNINTVDYDGGSREAYVNFMWDLPYEEDMTYYLRAYVEDYQANDNVPEVMFYYDNTEPMLAVDAMITTLVDMPVWDGEIAQVLDYRADSVRTFLEYAMDEFHGLYDIKSVTVNLLTPGWRTTYELGTATYAVTGITDANFEYDMTDQDAISGEYAVQVLLEDFAGNTAEYPFYLDPYIIIDNTAPVFEDVLDHVVDMYQADGFDISDGNAIDFIFPTGEEERYVNWSDPEVDGDMFLGVETVEMRLYAITQTDTLADFVEGVIDSLGNIYFSWIPDALADYLYETINIEITMTDFYGNSTTAAATQTIELWDTEVSKARILEVQDNMVDWQDEIQPDVWVTGHWAEIDAYVPLSVDNVDNVVFEWFDPVLEDWVEIDVVSQSTVVTNPPYEYPNSELFVAGWDMSELENGDHLIRAIAYDQAGLADDAPWEVTVHKADYQDYPEVFVWNGDMAAAELVRGSYYNLTAASEYPEAFNDLTFKYRYVDEEGEYPTDEWFVIGNDEDGEVPLYLNNWLIHNTMVPGLEIQIIAIADYLGGSGRYDQPTEQEIFDMGLYVQLPIVDVTPPEIQDITFNVYEEEERSLAPYWPYINNTETTMIDTIMAWIAAEYYELDGEYSEDMNDLHRIYLSYTEAEERTTHLLEEVWFTDEAETNPYEYMYTNYDMGWDISEFDNGEYSVDLQVWDTADNTASINIPFWVDTVAPTSDLVITDLEGGEVEFLERGETYLLTANAADNIGIMGYGYAYQIDGEGSYTEGLDFAGDTAEFTVPEDVEYGAELEFTVVVVDNVNLTHSSSVSRFVFDSETLEMLITHVGGAPYVPNMHINGEVGLDVLLLGNTEPDLVTNVALKYRYTGGTDWMLIDADAPVVPVTGGDNDAAYDIWDVEDLDEGLVELGVVPVSDPDNIWEEPLYWATLYIDHTAPNLAMPDVVIPSCINGDVLRIEFAELPADLNHNSVRFEYVIADQADIEEAWMTIDEQPEFGFDSGYWFFELAGLEEDDRYSAMFENSGMYDFRLHFADVAIPEANTAKLNEIEEVDGGTLFDNVEPVAFVSQVNDYIAPFGTIEVELATTVDFTVTAFEMPELYPYVCGVEMVEFWIDDMDFMLGVDYYDGDDLFNMSWPTHGLLIGEYTIDIIAYDYAGNFETDHVHVDLVSDIDPIAIIAGFDFDEENPNVDRIFAVTKDCVDNPTNGVIFEYTNDYENWYPFAGGDSVEIVNGVELWSATFNANGMEDVQMLRAVSIKGNGEYSDRVPLLSVEYSDAMGGMFLFDTNEDVNVYYDDVVDVMDAESKPIVLQMVESVSSAQTGAEYLLDPEQMADAPEHYQAPFDCTTCELDNNYDNIVTFWTSTLSNNMITLENAMFTIHEISAGLGSNGEITSENGEMAVEVPIGGGTGHLYFEDVHWIDLPPIPGEWYPISDPNALMGDMNLEGVEFDQWSIFNVEITSPIDGWPYNPDEGLVQALWYDGTEWTMYPLTVMDDYGYFVAPPEEGIYILVQTLDFAPELEYVTVRNEWWDGNDLWTAYDWDYWWYHEGGGRTDSIYVEEGIDFSFRTFVVENEGEYEVDTDAIIDVYLNGIRIVNNGVPDPEYVGMPIVIDPVSGIFHINLINQEYLETHNDGLGHELEVFVDVLGYTSSIETVFNVDYTEPLVQNDGGGYVRHEMTIWANIWDPQTDIFTDWIELRLYNPEDVDNPEEHIIVPYPSLDVTYDEENGWYHVEYTITLDDLTTVLLGTADVNEVYAQWWAINNVNIETPWYLGYNVVPYVVDIAPPIVWAISPVGDPLDNDGDGLFNEDPINGVNEDLDFDDWNNNGVQDGMWVSDSSGTYWVGEPSFIDEDPIDFHPDTLLYGQEVVIAVGYEDIPMPIVVGDEDCGDCTIYSGASGVDIENIIVTLNGVELTDEMGTVTITEGTWQFAPDELLIPGHYVVIASVYDIAGNVGSVSYEFEILGVAPTISFIEPEAGWWLNPHDASTLQFTVEAMEGCPVAFDGVEVTIHTEDGELILGPSVISPDEYGVYSVTINAGIIDSDEDTINLGVTATTIFGDSSEGSQSYGVDSVAPTAQFTSPEDGEVFGLTNAIHVIATYSDIEEVGRKDSNGPQVSISSLDATRGNGSGIDSARLFITPPDGVTEIYNGSIDGYVETVIEPANLQVGEYTAMLEVIDNVGNLTNININFMVESPAPTIEFDPFAGGWWFNPANNIEPFTFSVHAGSGVDIAEDGVVVTFYGIQGMDVLQGPQTLPYNEEGEYQVFLGANVPSSYNGVVLEVQATNIFGGSTTSSQTYGIDTETPTVEFISPDDDAEFGLSAIVNVLVNYTDTSEDLALGRDAGLNIGTHSTNTRTYGSGIMSANLRVIDPDGAIVVNVDAGMDTYSLDAIVDELVVGTYTAFASVTDKANNTTIESIEFHVNDTSLGIEFFDLGHSDWWYGPELNVPLTFEVSGNVGENGVVANIYGMPDNELLQGPQYVYESQGMYSVWVAADVVEYDAIVLEVIATNVTGQSTMANQTYSIDIGTPIVSIESPSDGEEFDVGNVVDIRAYYSDGESGISDIVLKVDGVMIADSLMDMSLTSLLYTNEYALGEHNVELMVTDHVMNMTTMTWSFSVTDMNVDLVVNDITLMNNPIDFDAGETLELLVDVNKTAEVTVTLYDFAGKEVMTTNADNRGMISWDCRRGGVKVARGVYFARVIVTDGRSHIEEIVKIAVK